jgi:hypothetical protein
MVEGSGDRNVFNGVGLLDDIAVSEDIPGYVNPGLTATRMLGTSWCLAEAVAMDASGMYETDKHIYVGTFSEWDEDNSGTSGPTNTPVSELSLWRWDGSHWERVLKENVVEPWAGPPFWSFSGKGMFTNHGRNNFVDGWTWWPRLPRGFSTDPYVFLNAGRKQAAIGGGQTWINEWLWYSPDLGDTWIRVSQMPIGALPAGPGLSESGWWVEDNNLIFMGDMNGWVYKTTDRGSSWTEAR